MTARRFATIRTLIAMALACACSGAMGAPIPRSSPWSGQWSGAFSRQGSVQLVAMNLADQPGRTAAKSGLAGTYDIPELGLYGERLDNLAVTDSTVSLRLIYGAFQMRLNAADGELTGENRDWGPPVSIHLRRTAEGRCFDTLGVVASRSGSRIHATLYLPRVRGRVAAVVVAGGSTQTTRAVWEYRGWGPVLATRGVAALVYDRRGQGASTGDTADVDLSVEAADVLALVAKLRSRPEIDASRIGLLGMSRGGWVASLAAAASSDVKFLVLACAPAVSVMQQELQFVRHRELPDSLSADDLEGAVAFERLMMRAALDSIPWSVTEEAVARARVARWRDLVQIPDRPADLDWWRRNEYDQAAVLSRVNRPVLALFGGADRIVPADENAEPMRRALEGGGNADVTIRIVPRAGHGLYLFGRLLGGRWEWPASYWVWAAKAPGVFDEVADWVLAR